MITDAEFLKAPFPYFGGKGHVAEVVWEHLGASSRTYIEPFFGSGAVLLQRPRPSDGMGFAGRYLEIVNDKDAYVVNFWRAIQHDPEAVLEYAVTPINEPDFIARQRWLIAQGKPDAERMFHDVDYYDPKAAAWWAWGMGQQIGAGWCIPTKSGGVAGSKNHIATSMALFRGELYKGGTVRGYREMVRRWFTTLSDRLVGVRIMCGDWSYVVSPVVTTRGDGDTAVFLDPPYAHDAGIDTKTYRVTDDVAHEVFRWAEKVGSDPKLRLAVCGYEGSWTPPIGWTEFGWSAGGGWANTAKQESRGKQNRHRERIWFSPHCKVESAVFDLMGRAHG